MLSNFHLYFYQLFEIAIMEILCDNLIYFNSSLVQQINSDKTAFK